MFLSVGFEFYVKIKWFIQSVTVLWKMLLLSDMFRIFSASLVFLNFKIMILETNLFHLLSLRTMLSGLSDLLCIFKTFCSDIYN